ncbi:hypothetical protein B0H66DRAFT_591538 [Apodospora peruviana]|uniref:Uncharacterized protein n=1 Tax=Apodospora peruviana TaxID=516989 RepID=A0AAE0I769_9PEZI|nr:hypothetical protein B0H66DRAFT_591538 [Apodospora peruviana]
MPGVIKFSILTLAALRGVVATLYCQCENDTYDRIFPGIQQVCRTLSDDWCSTNCNVSGTNRDYCEFIPKGYGPTEDYAKLKSWCKWLLIRGGQLFHLRRLLVPQQRLQEAARPSGCPKGANPAMYTDKKAPDAYATFVLEDVLSQENKMAECGPPYDEAADDLVELKVFSDCTVDRSDSNAHTISCASLVGTSGNADLSDFEEACKSVGGVYEEVADDSLVAGIDLNNVGDLKVRQDDVVDTDEILDNVDIKRLLTGMAAATTDCSEFLASVTRIASWTILMLVKTSLTSVTSTSGTPKSGLSTLTGPRFNLLESLRRPELAKRRL